MSGVFSTTIRFNLEREEDRAALEWLQTMDRSEYKSYSRAVIAAVNDFFSRKARLKADPYLETREKEDAFLQRIQESVERGLSSVSVLTRAFQGMSGFSAETSEQPCVPNSSPMSDTEAGEDFEAAMDFIDSF